MNKTRSKARKDLVVTAVCLLYLLYASVGVFILHWETWSVVTIIQSCIAVFLSVFTITNIAELVWLQRNRGYARFGLILFTVAGIVGWMGLPVAWFSGLWGYAGFLQLGFFLAGCITYFIQYYVHYDIREKDFPERDD